VGVERFLIYFLLRYSTNSSIITGQAPKKKELAKIPPIQFVTIINVVGDISFSDIMEFQEHVPSILSDIILIGTRLYDKIKNSPLKKSLHQ